MEDKNLGGVHLPGSLAAGLSEFSWTHLLHPSYRLSPIEDTGPNPLSQAGITRKQEVRSLRPQLPGSCVLGQLRTWTFAFSLTSQGSPYPLAGIIQPSPTPCVSPVQ